MQNPQPTPYGRRVSWGVKDWAHSRILALLEVLPSHPTTPRNSTQSRINERSYNASIPTTRPMPCPADSSPNLEPSPEAGAAPPALQKTSGGRSTNSTSRGADVDSCKLCRFSMSVLRSAAWQDRGEPVRGEAGRFVVVDLGWELRQHALLQYPVRARQHPPPPTFGRGHGHVQVVSSGASS